MLVRIAVRLLVRNVKQTTKLVQFQVQVPKYNFFFDWKKKKQYTHLISELEKKRAEIESLYNQMSECSNEQDQMEVLKQVIELREEMGKSNQKKCIHLMLDKTDYAKYLVDMQKYDHRIVEEVLDESFLENFHYENVEFMKHPNGFEKFLWHSVAAAVMQLRILRLYDEAEEEQLKQWLEQFLESITFNKDYLLDNFDEISESEGFQQKEQVLSQYKCNLVYYHEMLGRLLIDTDQVQESIERFEIAIKENQNYLSIVSELSEHQDGEIADEAQILKEKAVGKFGALFQELGQIQLKLKDYDSARPYFEKSTEIFMQVYGKHSIEYATGFCSLASTYRFTDLAKCEEMLKDFHEYLDSFEQDAIFLEVGMEYFCILESQNRGTQELFEKIYDVRTLCDSDNLDLLLDYDILAIKYMVRNTVFLEHAHEFYEEALQIIDSILGPTQRAEKLLLLLDLAYLFVEPNNPIHDSILELIYDALQEPDLEQTEMNIQYQVDRAKAFLQIRLRECLIQTPEESLRSFKLYFTVWIENKMYQDELLRDTDEIIEQLIDNKMKTLAHKTLIELISIMKELEVEEFIEHYEKEAKQLQESIMQQ